VHYLPNRGHLLSETAPPPLNPKLQICLEDYTMGQYASNGDQIKASINNAKSFDVSYLPKKLQTRFKDSIDEANQGLGLVESVKDSKTKLESYVVGYQSLQKQVLYTNSDMKNVTRKIKDIKKEMEQIADESDEFSKLEQDIKNLTAEKLALEKTIPEEWESKHEQYKALDKQLSKDRRSYFNAVDSSTESLQELQAIIADSDKLVALAADLKALDEVIVNADISNKSKEAISKIKKVENAFASLKGANAIKSKLSKARRLLKKAKDDEAKDKAMGFMRQAHEAFATEVKWRKRAKTELLADLKSYEAALSTTIALRLQERLTDEQAKGVASCMSHHKDLSLAF
ncbi:MAG: hypothetical protein L3J46_10800, partial [Kangiellaceae bacterium]|nr:hypothetical protein [Kangiellaceae bacterium]